MRKKCVQCAQCARNHYPRPHTPRCLECEPNPARNCVLCGKSFVPANTLQQRCGDPCKWRTPRDSAPIPCPKCGTVFTPRGQQKYCYLGCARPNPKTVVITRAVPCSRCRHGSPSDASTIGWECRAERALACGPLGPARLLEARR